MLLAFCSAGLAAASAWLGKPWGLWLPTLVLTASWLLGQSLRLLWSPDLTRALAQLLQRSRLSGGLMLFSFPLVLIGLLLPPEETGGLIIPPAEALFAQELEPTRTVSALTDQDTPIPLLITPVRDADLLRKHEAKFIEQLHGSHPAVPLAAGDPSQNCHGWVFTGGQFFIDGIEVPRILEDNGYFPVANPQPGDLAIYRELSSGIISHTALVRMVTEEGVVLVESKWGMLGRYLHVADKLRLASPPTYYRSNRPGHLLRSLPQA